MVARLIFVCRHVLQCRFVFFFRSKGYVFFVLMFPVPYACETSNYINSNNKTLQVTLRSAAGDLDERTSFYGRVKRCFAEVQRRRRRQGHRRFLIIAIERNGDIDYNRVWGDVVWGSDKSLPAKTSCFWCLLSTCKATSVAEMWQSELAYIIVSDRQRLMH